MNEEVHTKLELEYTIKSSPKILYFFLNAPNGLSEWFCDNINVKDDIYTFCWDDEQRSAELISKKVNNYTQFRWLDLPQDTFFEFKLEVDDITKDVALIVTDFEPANEHENSKLLWDSQVTKLIQLVGG
ncbi:MAG: SRPBCC domain-containing protein [Bacteroidetes bacterium]|nr:SRPBCC domain-containing protein [Bacteroidota bacterium]HET6243643.1 START-like domain-containing protein [Bacteroidia bacterium]